MTRKSPSDRVEPSIEAISELSIAIYSVDPTSLSAFHSFDPESFSVLMTLNDALIHVGLNGDIEPALAMSWRRLAPDTMEFRLREGVRFHNGDPFTADDCVATFAAHQLPSPSACGAGVLSPIKRCVKIDDATIHIVTHFPDAMLLHRLFFSQIYPTSQLKHSGRDSFLTHPMGTGPYRLKHWRRGDEILLERNPDHWSGLTSVERLRIPIVRQKYWADLIERGIIDAAFNLDATDFTRLQRHTEIQTHTQKAALAQWFLLSHKGPLADEKVRQALNHCVHRGLIADVAEFGLAHPQKSIASEGQEGFFAGAKGYQYNPERARQLLKQAGYENGFALHGLVSETSASVYFVVREFFDA